MQILDALEVGDTVEVRGPFGHFHYDRPGHFRTPSLEGTVRRLSMVAGGTGITPMYQIIQAVLRDPEDRTEIRLLYANQSEDGILLHQELEALAAGDPDRCAPASRVAFAAFASLRALASPRYRLMCMHPVCGGCRGMRCLAVAGGAVRHHASGVHLDSVEPTTLCITRSVCCVQA